MLSALERRWLTLIAVLGLLLSYVRIFLGTEVTDEPYHIAAAYLTALGGRFFENDAYFAQMASIPYEPLVYVYQKVMGGFGSVLFVRHLYFLFALLAAFSLYRLLRRFVPSRVALVVSVIPVVYIHSAVPAMGYNTFGTFGFAVGVGWTVSGYLSRKTWEYLVGGWGFAISLFSYPPFVIGAAAIYTGLMIDALLRTRKWDWSVVIGALAGASIFLFFWGVTIFRAGLEPIEDAMKLTQAYGALSGFAAKWDNLVGLTGAVSPPAWVFAVLAATGLVLRWFALAWFWLLIPLVLAFEFLVPEPTWALRSGMFLCWGFVLALLATRKSAQTELNRVSVVITVACLLMSFALWMTSGNGALSSSLAAQHGLMFMLAVGYSDVWHRLMVVAMTFVIGGLVVWGYGFSYREDPVRDFDTLIRSGPFAGIITTEYKAELLKQIEEDLNASRAGAESILFYDNFPVGFLFTDLRPATRNLFVHPVPYGFVDRDRYVDYFRIPSRRPDLFVQFERFPFSREWTQSYRTYWTAFDSFFDYLPSTGDYEIVVNRPDYKIWKKRELIHY